MSNGLENVWVKCIIEREYGMIDFIARLLTSLIPFRPVRKKLRNQIRTIFYGWHIITKAKKVGKSLFVGGPSFIGNNVYLGEHVNFNGMQIHGSGKVTIGNYFHSGVECLIIAQNHNYEGEKIPYDETYIYKDIEIGDFVWLGSRVMILPGTKIGEGAIIQGGSVVHGVIPPYAIAGGNPAKVFKYRDIEHFKKLKAEGKFH